MNRCDICGEVTDASHPFRICSQCILGEALEPDEEEAIGSAPPPRRRMPCSALPQRPDFFDKYEIIERIGKGGQGDVWKVWDGELRRHIAMKRLSERHLASEAVVYRFLAEAQIASQLEHPGILPIFDVGLDPDGRPFYTTQLVPGTTLEEIWKAARHETEERPSQARALELLLRVCEVIANAHSHGVIHRDLKPSNILVGSFGDVRVIDWGSAYVLEQERGQFDESFVPLNRTVIQTDREQAMWGLVSSPLSTAAAGYPVTIVYTPPEALKGGSVAFGPATDIYAIGVMLYHLLTGRLPYAAADGALPEPLALRTQAITEPPGPVRSIAPAVSQDLAAICSQAMARDVADRYRTALDVAADIRAFLETRPVQARGPGRWLRIQRWTQRNLLRLALAGVVTLILGSAFAIAQGFKAQRDVARQLTALRSADLAARSGRWRDHLRFLGEAEAAGYRDKVDLGLHRAEAWTVLNAPSKSRAQLERLIAHSPTDARRGEVLLRLGEHELFNPTTSAQGIAHVQEALATRLNRADTAFAHGLLAASSPEALRGFRQTLELDPYHHGAHRHSLGMEFLLGQRDEFAAHARIFRVLYPDDPSPHYPEVMCLALDGKPSDAEIHISRLTDSTPELRIRLANAVAAGAELAKRFDPESAESQRPARNDLSNPAAAAPDVTLINVSDGRSPALPSIQHYREGLRAVAALALLTDPHGALYEVKRAWHHHPESLLPVTAADALERRHPTSGARIVRLLIEQAELYQLGADSTSIIPGLPRHARFRAAQLQFELWQLDHTNSPAWRAACLDNLSKLQGADLRMASKLKTCFDMALALEEYDLARHLIGQWERSASGDGSVLPSRIRLEIESGSLATALHLINGLLEKESVPAWALEQKKSVKERLTRLLNSFDPPQQFQP